MIFIEVAVQKFRQSAQIIPFSKMFTMAVAEKTVPRQNQFDTLKMTDLD